MSPDSQSPSNPNILGALAGLIGILGIFLYFTGWIYRWSYFGYFELEIISLNFPLESFLIVPIQVFLGSFQAIIKFLLAIIVATFLIKFTLCLLTANRSNIKATSNPSPPTPIIKGRGRKNGVKLWLLGLLTANRSNIKATSNPSPPTPLNKGGDRKNGVKLWLLGLLTANRSNIKATSNPSPPTPLNKGGVREQLISLLTKNGFKIVLTVRQFLAVIPNVLLKDLVIVVWVLIVLFWLAKCQGFEDARRDALNSSSTRPVVALVTSDDQLALGRQLDDEFFDPPLKGYRIIGDKKLFEEIRGREINDVTNKNNPIVWRLLLQTDSWVYVFSALPSNSKPNERPPVLAISTADGRIQFLILSRPKMK